MSLLIGNLQFIGIKMGMYNEVYKKCPECGKQSVLQIAQVVMGFGEFDLDDPNSIIATFEAIHFDVEECCRTLKDYIVGALNDGRRFECECGHSFNLSKSVRSSKQSALRILRLLNE